MSVLIFKVVAFVTILLTGLIGGFLSVRMATSARSERFFSLGSAFAGGIFLGAGLLHMIPDAQDGFASLLADYEFPWVPLLCAAGFLLVLLIEKVLVHERNIVAQSAGGESGPTFYPYVLTLVLSVHSIIAGIALGTEETMVRSVIIFIALISHKGSAAFALGVSLHRGGVRRTRSLRILLFFCFMTPLGIVLGSTLTYLLSGRTEQVFTSVFDALAAGTFLYVAVLDIIQEEFIRPEDRRFKFILLAFGLGLMAVLAIWT